MVATVGGGGVGEPTPGEEADAQEIATLIRRGIAAGEPYFEWRAEQAAAGDELNVVNNCGWLFERYTYFRNCFKVLLAEAEQRHAKRTVDTRLLESGGVVTTTSFPSYALQRAKDAALR
jgi:hypothetical protein